MLQDRVKSIIEDINKAIERYLAVGEVEGLIETMKYYPMAGGKRLRPLIAVLVAEALGGRGSAAMPFAVALELTHSFTLVHDDIMDMDTTRRGVATLHTIYGVPVAINAGDALFARAMEILIDLDLNLDRFKAVLREYAAMVRGIAEGQHMDMEFEKIASVSITEYLRMIEKKTALMFKAAAKCGAIIANASSEQVRAMEKYGLNLGLSFQIWDDVLDVKADQAVLGKDVGSDIRNGKKSIVILYGLEKLKGEAREKFLKAFGNKAADDETVKVAIKALKDCGAIAYAESRARNYATNARRHLGCLPPSVEKEILNELVDYMVKRKF